MTVRLLHFEQYHNEQTMPSSMGPECPGAKFARVMKLEQASLVKCITLIMFNAETRLALSDVRTKVTFKSSFDEALWSAMRLEKCTLDPDKLTIMFDERQTKVAHYIQIETNTRLDNIQIELYGICDVAQLAEHEKRAKDQAETAALKCTLQYMRRKGHAAAFNALLASAQAAHPN